MEVLVGVALGMFAASFCNWKVSFLVVLTIGAFTLSAKAILGVIASVVALAAMYLYKFTNGLDWELSFSDSEKGPDSGALWESKGRWKK